MISEDMKLFANFKKRPNASSNVGLSACHCNHACQKHRAVHKTAVTESDPS